LIALTLPLRERYFPPCLATMPCTFAAYSGIQPSSVTFTFEIRYTAMVASVLASARLTDLARPELVHAGQSPKVVVETRARHT
jgi:hypothetical protein